jgi:hypothetical protein
MPHKVLVCGHPEADYGSHYLFNGLCRVLGHENVYDYPNNPTYHGKDNNGYIRPWHHDEPGNTGRLKWFDEGYPEKPLDLEAVSGLLRDGYFDIVVLESWRWTVQRTWDALKGDIRASGAKVLLHDGEDYHSFNGDALETVRPDYYLKRELLKNYDFGNQSGPIALPLPFSAPDQIVEWADKQPHTHQYYTAACLLGLSWQPRQELANELRRGVQANEYGAYVATNADSDRNNPQHLLGEGVGRRHLPLLGMRGSDGVACGRTEHPDTAPVHPRNERAHLQQRDRLPPPLQGTLQQ